MTVAKLKKDLTQFKKDVQTYRELLLGSRNAIGDITSNRATVQGDRSKLNLKYARLETHIRKLGRGPQYADPVWRIPQDVYMLAFSNDILQRVGPAIDAVLDDLDYVIGKANSAYIKDLAKAAPRRAKMIGKQLLGKIPTDLQVHCNELNFNIAQEKPIAAMLLLRKVVPLSIVRFFQSKGIENKILNGDGEYINPEGLLGKLEEELRAKRPVKILRKDKVLTDAIQHHYTYLPEMERVRVVVDNFVLCLSEMYS